MEYRIGDSNVVPVTTAVPTCETGNGEANDAVSTVSATEYGAGLVHKTVLTLEDFTVAMSDAAGTTGYGGAKLYDLPEGAICFLGAVADLDLTKSSAGIDDDWDGDFSVGTDTAGTDASLSLTEANIIPSTATPQASGGVTTAAGQTGTAGSTVVDGTATALDVYLNLLVDDADHDITSTAANIVVDGTVTLSWMNLGDN